ncbi:NAD(P)H-quinone oxidoreductase [Noviherbaspirillum sp. Root189]|uniref:NAD(P)H-quinone oxidoreductase n=1 Tax=Noviherbaspirillum sp. Root189 TaxID=1736487 RepID=UPI0007111612|nr:NAD(P)H-quinone oxidoreductase [Noviherbaspirillum sp. Root189]KRB86980.1 NAD(P)H-quinone oxidoreductase [Noviherbaspirillum sp. Root189]
MRCVDLPRFGGPEVMRLTERPVPRPGASELLIQVAAAGVNRGDTVQRRGHYPPPPGASDIPGLEVAGVVVEVGSSVSGWKVGQRVCALLTGGGYAEYCHVPAVQCLPVPVGLSFTEAAALPEACFTVWTMLWDAGRLAPGETILIQGGTSGIGVMAIQMGAALGHRVIATAGSDTKCEVCKSLGAEAAINYRTTDFESAVKDLTSGRGVDVILDMVGGDYVKREQNIMTDGGRLVFIAFLGGTSASFDIRQMMHRRLTLTGATLRARSVEFKAAIADQLRTQIWPLIETKRIRPIIDSTYPLEQVAQAHERIESGDHIGKILLTLSDVENDLIRP